MSRTISRIVAVAVAIVVALGALASTPVASAAACPSSAAARLSDRALVMPRVLAGPAIDLEVTNVGTIAHELAVSQVKPGTTIAEVIAAEARGDDAPAFFITDPGGINLLGRGGRLRLQRVLAPGTYVFHNANADLDVRLTPAVWAIVTVVDRHQRLRPVPSRVIGLGDDAVTLPAITAGTRAYAIRNLGTTPHELFIVGVTDPADLDRSDDLGTWLEGGQAGPPPFPVHFPGGIQTIEPGVTVILTMTLRRGTTYAFVDFSTGATNIALVG